MVKSLFVALLTALATQMGAQAQVARFDAATGELHIPTVAVGASVYADVRLKDAGGLVFGLQAAVLALPSGAPGWAQFDAGANLLRLPQVLVGTQLYRDVVLQHLGDYRFALQSATAAASPPVVRAPARWLDVWLDTQRLTSSTSAFAELQLGLLDPAPGVTSATEVDRILVKFGSSESVTRIPGGHFDPLTHTLTEAGTRQLIYGDEQEARHYRLLLDRRADGSLPQPEVLPAACSKPRPQVLAHSATGDELVLQCGDQQFQALPLTGGAVAFAAPEPGSSPFYPTLLVGAQRDPDTGALRHLYWLARRTRDAATVTASRLLRTDARGQGAVLLFETPLGISASAGGLALRQGLFVGMGGVLVRHDFASGGTRQVSDLTINFTSPVADADHFMMPGPSGVLRCPDHADATCVTLPNAAAFILQTGGRSPHSPQHVAKASSGAVAQLVRKADGALLTVPALGSLRGSSLLLQGGAGGGGLVTAERLLFARAANESGQLNWRVGSVDTQGADLRETAGSFLFPYARWAVAAPAHLGSWRADLLPTVQPQLRPSEQQLLWNPVVANGRTGFALQWLQRASGNAGPVLGSIDWPSASVKFDTLLGPSLGQLEVDKQRLMVDRQWNDDMAAAQAVLALGRVVSGTHVLPVAAWRVGEAAGSLLPLRVQAR